MIEATIRWSLSNRFLVLAGSIALILGGVVAVYRTPVDAIPDLSDVQVIVRASFSGQAPQVVEDQVTYPLSTALMAVPGARTVRGFSFLGDSYVYVIFDEDTDLYWARARVLEYLGQVKPNLPDGVSPRLGPDATGVGWVYIYALVDRSGKHDLAQLRSIQDWFLRYELQTVRGVAEVATVGGMVRQYQVRVDPQKLRAYDIPLSRVQEAIRRGNAEQGASVLELSGAEHMVTTTGYVSSVEDLNAIPLKATPTGTPIQLRDVAEVVLGPQLRRGIAELDGEGETVGGIVVMRSGENARATIDGVRTRLNELRDSLPAGVELVTVYDRSGLIDRAVENLWRKLLEEFAIVSLVCMLFLFHLRSSLVAVVSLPIGILMAFIVTHWQGINANIMSLGGIAIAVGTMIDGAIVLVENLHRHAEREPLTDANRWRIVQSAAVEVGPALFFSLSIITVSFLPVFTLEAQEGRLFAPLAFTKTYAMAAAAALSVTLIPVLLGYLVRGRLRPESRHPVNRALIDIYRPLLQLALRHPRTVLLTALLIALSSLWPLSRLGSEFIPPLDEGDLMYMPTTYPAISIGEARRLLQQTDSLIATLPEVERVFGKVGRAETATDPAPLTMIETFIRLRPRDEWRTGMTLEKLKKELDDLVSLPGVTNAWVMPIKTRIDMLATGVKTPIGIKVAGPELQGIEAVGKQLESVLRELPGTASVYSERVVGGRYVTVDIDRERAARFGLNVADVQNVVATAVGGRGVGEAVEGRERYPINVRYPQYWRDSPEKLAELPFVSEQGSHLALGDVAAITITGGAAGIKSENARLNAWTYIDVSGADIGRYVRAAQQKVAAELNLPAGYSLTWAGQYEYLERAKARLTLIVPLTIALITLLLYLNFRRLSDVVLLLATLPLALAGSLWLLYAMGYNLSVAVGVGFIALAGVAIETSVIMLVYLKQSLRDCDRAESLDADVLRQSVLDGAIRRVRPVIMTATATTLGLLPILLGDGAGSEVMGRIAAPVVGGMLSATLLTLIVVPTAYLLWQLRHPST